MARSKRQQNQPYNVCGYHGEVYWGSEEYNKRLYDAYMTQVLNLAFTRFEWRGLPATVDALWLERCLLMRGVATVAHPIRDGRRGLWVATRAVTDGALNIYDRPSRWFAEARDLVRFGCTPKNGVLIYDNATRTCAIDALDLNVRELVDIQKTKQLNRFGQKIPYILVTPPDMELTAVNLLAQIMAGTPATIANKAIRDIDAYKIDMAVPYLGTELTAAEQNVWNRIYTLLGISNVTFKSERMIEDEVRSMSEPASMMAMSGLVTRRQAANYLNDAFGLDVHVIWRADNESENINKLENVESAARIMAGTNKGMLEVTSHD